MRFGKTKIWRRLFALMSVGTLLAGVAGAHPQFALSTVNRYGTVALAGASGGRLFYTFMIGDVPSHALRRQADRDGDGRLDAAEQQALLGQFLTQMTDLKVQLDGKDLPLRFEAAPLTLPDPRVSPLAFSVELSAPLPLTGNSTSEHLLRFDDHVSMAPIGDVELRIDEGPSVRVRKTWEGATEPATQNVAKADAKDKKTQLFFQWQGPPRSSLSDRSVSVRFARETTAEKKSRFTFGGCAGGGRW